MKVFALIPARGGSKGVPKKNISIVNGKPLIEYTIEAALESTLLSSIVVSSDDPAVEEITRYYNKINFHKRDINIAGDTSSIAETIDALLEKDLYKKFDAVMLLQPTSPIRTGKNIDEAVLKLENNIKANSLISVCPMNDIHPARMYWKDKEILCPIIEEFELNRRQDIPTAYFRNGSIYLTRISAFVKNRKVMEKPSIAYEMPNSYLLNIDEPRDLLIAEVLIKAWKEGKL